MPMLITFNKIEKKLLLRSKNTSFCNKNYMKEASGISFRISESKYLTEKKNRLKRVKNEKNIFLLESDDERRHLESIYSLSTISG